MTEMGGTTCNFRYSRWSNYGALIYGLLFPLVLIAWLFLTPTKIVHGEWGIALLAAYYAYQLGMVWYRLIKTPLTIAMAGNSITFVFLGGRAVSWKAVEIGEVLTSKCRRLWFADTEVIVTRKDEQGAMTIRPEVKGGQERMLEAFRQLGVTVRERASQEGIIDG